MTDESMSQLSQRLQACLDRLKEGDATARNELINISCQRLEILTRKMLNDYDRLRQWEQTGDVLQNAAIRLRRALESVTPGTVREFFGLAAVQIRRELIDLSRAHYGRREDPDEAPEEDLGNGLPADDIAKSPKPRKKTKRPPGPRGPIHEGLLGGGSDDESPLIDEGDTSTDGGKLAMWTEFHEFVETLSPKEREIIDLLWYQELSQEQAADVLGVDKSTVKRRWRDLKFKLHEHLQGWLPGT